MKKSCYDCFNFIATIPLIKEKNSLCREPEKICQILKKKLNYKKATATCKHGLLTNVKEEPRIFKNVLSCGKNLSSYQQADRCQYYNGDE